MQDNFNYPRIKKIHQVLEKITRFDQKVKILVSCNHMNCCIQNILHINLHILYIIQVKTRSNIQELSKYIQYIKSYKKNNFLIILFTLFSSCNTFEFEASPIFR